MKMKNFLLFVLFLVTGIAAASPSSMKDTAAAQRAQRDYQVQQSRERIRLKEGKDQQEAQVSIAEMKENAAVLEMHMGVPKAEMAKKAHNFHLENKVENQNQLRATEAATVEAAKQTETIAENGRNVVRRRNEARQKQLQEQEMRKQVQQAETRKWLQEQERRKQLQEEESRKWL